MDVSAAEIVLGLVVVTCAVGAAYGARWVSRRSDEQMERTRAALRARHAVPDQPVSPPSGSPRPGSPLPGSPLPDSPLPSSPVSPPVTPSPAPDAVDEDPESSGRHRVPEELMRASTYSLSPDRVARAKVPNPRPQRGSGQLTERLR